MKSENEKKREKTPVGIYKHPETGVEVHAQEAVMAAALKDEGFTFVESFEDRALAERLEKIPEAEVVITPEAEKAKISPKKAKTAQK